MPESLNDLIAKARRLLNSMTRAELEAMVEQQTKNLARTSPTDAPSVKATFNTPLMPEYAKGGTYTGRASSDRPNHGAPPSSSQPKRDVKKIVEGLDKGLSLEDALKAAEIKFNPYWRENSDGTFDMKPLTVGDLAAILTTLEPTMQIVGPQGSPYVGVFPQTNGNVLIAEYGDNKTKADCQVKFTNKINFCGFPGSSMEVENTFMKAYDKEPVFTLSVYVDDGNVFDYTVKGETAARDHTSAIIKTGYRHVSETVKDTLVHYPPHRIMKVKITGRISTNYTDRPRGT